MASRSGQRRERTVCSVRPKAGAGIQGACGMAAREQKTKRVLFTNLGLSGPSWRFRSAPSANPV